MPARAIATFGVYGPPSEDEGAVLELADEFRAALALIEYERHCAIIDYRNERFPALFTALGKADRCYWRIADIERRIKAHHSEVRDRNASTPELDAELKEARDERAGLTKDVAAQRKLWSAHVKEFGLWWKTAAEWKNVKSLDKRRIAYDALDFPRHLAEYGRMIVGFDLRKRELSRDYQARGLHSEVRIEIVEATQPKLGKDGPGVRYRYGRKPELRPWRRITLPFVGGKTFGDLIGGTSGMRIMPIYANHPSGGEETVYEVTQQIGTSDQPRTITYRFKAHRPIPEETRLQRWTLLVDGNKRDVIPLAHDWPAKAQGVGEFGYRLCWTVRKEGVEIAEFWGEHVSEQLILPQWLVDNRMAVAVAQTAADHACNEWLERFRGVNRSKKPGAVHGFAALEAWCKDQPNDNGAENLRDHWQRIMARSMKQATKARLAIEDIYRMVASRVCRLHDSVSHPAIDLVRIKKYDTRDLLREDVLPAKSREIMFAVAPGKLREAIKQYGLASGEVPREKSTDARNTDVFTTYVRSLGIKTGTKPNAPSHRSQHRPQTPEA